MFKYLACRNLGAYRFDDRLTTNITVKDAIGVLQALYRETITHRRQFMSMEDIVYILFHKLGRLSIGMLLERNSDLETDDVDLSRIDQVIESLRGVRGELVTIQYIISLLPRKSIVPYEAPDEREVDPFADLLPERPAHMEQIGPLSMAIELGMPYPPGTSPSDLLTDSQARNLYNLYWNLNKMLDRTRGMMGMPTIIDGIDQVEERNRNRSLFLLRMRGHHIREAIPSLGYNCLPLQGGEVTFYGTLMDIYTELIKKNTSMFFRYQLMFEKFYQIFEQELIKLAGQRKKNEKAGKIRILDIGISTGEEALTIVLLAAICLEKNRQRLTKVLGKDPGNISDWVELTGTEKKAKYYEDIESFLKGARYPKALIDEIPSKYLELARKYGLIIEDENAFWFSQSIMDTIQIHYLSFFEQGSLSDPIFSQQYDFVFYIKVMEYLMTDPKSMEQAATGQAFLGLFDSGQLLKPFGNFFTDGNQLRAGWTMMMMRAFKEGAMHAIMRRMPGGAGELMEGIIGPRSTASNNPLDMFQHGEISFPMIARPLADYSFGKVHLGYPQDEVEIYKFSGRVTTPETDIRIELEKLEKKLRAVRKMLAGGPRRFRSPFHYAQALSEEEQTIARLRELRGELRELQAGKK